MNPRRRHWLLALAAALPGQALAREGGSGRTPPPDAVRRGRVLAFPRDHGAHPDARTEWWYATGWLGEPQAPTAGFQLTFFRSRTGLAPASRSHFAPRQLLFAHAALTTLGTEGTHRHDDRLVRWNGDPASALAHAALDDGRIRIGDWWLQRRGEAWHARLPARGFTLELQMARTQPVLLQGDAGFSRKGPDESQASHYYSEPQLAVRSLRGETGRAWLDHEWSDELLHPQAIGWDWVGFNLFDGRALTAFRLRRRDGSTLWAGGSWREPGGPVQAFAPESVRMQPGRAWRSPATGASYPVQWQLAVPGAGAVTVQALRDAQEMDSRASTGTVYWEGLSELLDGQGRRIGLGYLEMTGYVAPLRL